MILKFLLIFLFSVQALGSNESFLEFLDANKHKTNVLFSEEEKRQLTKCHKMFRNKPEFNRWTEAVFKEKKAEQDLLSVRELLKEFQTQIILARKRAVELEQDLLIDSMNSQNQQDIIIKYKKLKSEEQTAYEDKKMALEMLHNARAERDQAKKDRKALEEAFKKSIPETPTEDFLKVQDNFS